MVAERRDRGDRGGGGGGGGDRGDGSESGVVVTAMRCHEATKCLSVK